MSGMAEVEAYVVYRNEFPCAVLDTIEECADFIGCSLSMAKWCTTPSAKKRAGKRKRAARDNYVIERVRA